MKKRHLRRHRHIACNTINYNENFLQQTTMNETNDNEIIILCKRNTITDIQKELLKKGLSFVPKPKDKNIKQLYTDLCQFIQKLRRTFTSHSYQKKRQETKNIDPIRPARKPPKYIETSCGNNNLETFIHRIRLEIINPEKHIQQKKDNLTRAQRRALKELTTNKNIVINKADKGSTIVIEDREDYIQNAYEHLNNPTVYQELDNDDSEKHKQIINQKLERLHTAGLIQSNWFEYCKPPKKHRTSRLYFLKKIHKNPMSIRPIVSSCNSITENISKFIDTWLQPYVQTLPSFIKDTTDIFKAPPLIATRNSHSLRNKLVRAKLPTEDTKRESNDTTLNPDTTQPTNLPDEYPICLFNKTSQNFRNPITRCTKNCIICKMLATNLFARSTSKKTKHQTTLPPEDQHYNCKSKNVIYLATCNYKNCAAQYIGYTTRSLRDRIYEHLQTNTSAIYKHCTQLHHPLQKVKFQILTQAPKDTKNKDLWLRQLVSQATPIPLRGKGLVRLRYRTGDNAKILA